MGSTNQFETIEFVTPDGVTCNLQRLKRDSAASKGPIMLVHGAGVRGNIFNPPTKKNLVTVLAEEGYDVWLENWRASIDLEPNPWDLDKVALNDHPAAVKKIVEETGAEEIKAIVHCQGSTSFMMSAALGLVPQVKVIISNAVSLHPVVPKFSRFKLKVFVPLIKHFFKYLNPQWGLDAPDLKTRLLRWFVKLTHKENDTNVGKFVSFTYGSGFPALWRLENLDDETKEWIQHEFAEVPVRFFEHISKCVDHGKLVPYTRESDMPENYVDDFKSKCRIVLFAGKHNLCFKPESQERTFKYLEKRGPSMHKLYVLQEYSHLDVFLGKNAQEDVFPIMLKELNES